MRRVSRVQLLLLLLLCLLNIAVTNYCTGTIISAAVVPRAFLALPCVGGAGDQPGARPAPNKDIHSQTRDGNVLDAVATLAIGEMLLQYTQATMVSRGFVAPIGVWYADGAAACPGPWWGGVAA